MFMALAMNLGFTLRCFMATTFSITHDPIVLYIFSHNINIKSYRNTPYLIITPHFCDYIIYHGYSSGLWCIPLICLLILKIIYGSTVLCGFKFNKNWKVSFFWWSLGVVVLSIHGDVAWLVSLSILVLPSHTHIHQHSDHTHTSIHDIIGDSTASAGVVHS